VRPATSDRLDEPVAGYKTYIQGIACFRFGAIVEEIHDAQRDVTELE
jgi:hypothetical protein